jgi:hypothetical protein
MDTRITPFGDHPDGGKIKHFADDEPMPDHMMPISAQAEMILENIPQQERVNFILHSKDPRLKKEREWLENKLRKEHIKEVLEKYCNE